MKITNTCLAYVLKTGLPATNFVVGKIRFENKKITGTVLDLLPVLRIDEDDNGLFVVVGDEKQPRVFRENADVEIFLKLVPDDFPTFRPFDESNRSSGGDVTELDRIKRILAAGLALRNFKSLTGWAIEGLSFVGDDAELMVVFQNEGDALLIGSIFHEHFGDANTDYTAIMPTKEPTVPWLSEEETARLNGENEKRA